MGLHHSWIVTPGWGDNNRHISHFREAFTMLLKAVEQITLDRIFCFNSDQCQIVADPNRVLVAGHGTSGWLALTVATALPDRVLGVIAMAPRYTPRQFGYMHLALDPSMLAVLDRHQGWRHIERSGRTLQGVPVFMAVYENDTIVDRSSIWKLSAALSAVDVNISHSISSFPAWHRRVDSPSQHAAEMPHTPSTRSGRNGGGWTKNSAGWSLVFSTTGLMAQWSLTLLELVIYE